MVESSHLVLVPGLGADDRLFDPQRQELPDLIVPPWLLPERRETLPHYATRMAEGLRPPRPLVLGGVSLGGMLACEMATTLRPDAVVLVASCRTPKAIRPLVRPLGPISRVLPAALFRAAKLLARPWLALTSPLTPPQREACVKMFRDADPHFMGWALEAVLHWEPSPLTGIRVCHIHGQRDMVIRARYVQADQLIPGGTHLINITHAREVNRFLRRVLDEAAKGADRRGDLGI